MRCLLATIFALVQLSVAATKCRKEGAPDCKECVLPTLLPDRDCPRVGYDCHESNDVALNFNTSWSSSSGCARLSCADPLARLFVDRSDKKLLRCRSHHWHYGKRDCERTAHAICARPCTTCKTEVPACMSRDFHKASISSASVSLPCPIASCNGGADVALYGVRGHNGSDLVIDRIDEGRLTCGGGGVWKSAGGNYDYAVCGDATYSCNECEDITGASVDPVFGLTDLIGVNPTRSDANGCSRYVCPRGNVLVKLGGRSFAAGQVVCGPSGKWLIDGVARESVDGISCGISCTTCSRGFDGNGASTHFQKPFFRTDPMSGCAVVSCGTAEPYYLDDVYDVVYMNGPTYPREPLPCDGDAQRWLYVSERYYQLACQRNACMNCVRLLQHDPANMPPAPPGYEFTNDYAYEGSGGCKSMHCDGGALPVVMSNDNSQTPVVSKLNCDAYGLWNVDGSQVPEAMFVACAKSCSECSTASRGGAYDSPSFFSESTSGCMIATCFDDVFFASNGSAYQPQINQEDPIVAKCGSDGMWTVGAYCFSSIACAKSGSQCTNGCPLELSLLNSAPYGYATTPKQFTYSSGSDSCATISCELPFKLAVERRSAPNIPVLASTLNCRGNNKWYRDQFERLEANKAGCVAPCDKCSVDFPTTDRNFTKATFRTGTNGCLTSLACPAGSFFYMNSSGAEPVEVHEEVVPECYNGRWSIGGELVQYIGCKAPCGPIKELACPRSKACALNLERSIDNTFICGEGGRLLKATSQNGNVTDGQYLVCSSGGKWWSPMPAKVDYAYFTCVYECDFGCKTGTDGELQSNPARVKITADCLQATCEPGQALFGIGENIEPIQIGGSEAKCVYGESGAKWLAKKTGGTYSTVFCADI